MTYTTLFILFLIYIAILVICGYLYFHLQVWALKKWRILTWLNGLLFMTATYILPYIPLVIAIRIYDPSGADGLGWLFVFTFFYGTIPMILISAIILYKLNAAAKRRMKRK